MATIAPYIRLSPSDVQKLFTNFYRGISLPRTKIQMDSERGFCSISFSFLFAILHLS